jgi:dynein heavy chain, axonemal
VSDKLQTLNDDFAAMSKKKKDLEDNIDLCSQKLERAKKLIGGLGGERTRWGHLATSLEGRLQNVTGDSLIAAAFVTFLGHLSNEQRQEKLDEWHMILEGLNVPHSHPFNLQKCVNAEDWPEGWLSDDIYAIESAIIAENCDSWPLIFDPDGQAAAWLAAAHPRLLQTSTAHPEFALQLEMALQEGLPLLVELQKPEIPPILGKDKANRAEKS